ncbi:MAG: Hemagglutinin, partial [Veillonella sp. DORA_A_3_16_22]
LTKDGVTITTAGKDNVSLTGNGLDNGNNKIVNVADGTNDTDAVNVRQLEAKTKASTTELTANGGESAGSTTGNIVLTKKTAADGHIIYNNKLNDKVTLGTDPTKAVTVDGTNGTIKAGKDGNAVAINGTDGTIKAGDGTNAVAIDGKNGSVK